MDHPGAQSVLEAIRCAPWLTGLAFVDGIISGVGAVLGFVPQMLVLFLFLAFWRNAGIWRVSHLLWIEFSGNSDCPGKVIYPDADRNRMWCPGVMASRTIENDRDRKNDDHDDDIYSVRGKTSDHRTDPQAHCSAERPAVAPKRIFCKGSRRSSAPVSF